MRREKKIVNFYPNLNEETMKSWWMKYQKSRPERKKTILPNGSKKIVMILKQSKIDDALSALLIGFNPYLADPSTRGILSKTQYPDGYLSIGLKPLS